MGNCSPSPRRCGHPTSPSRSPLIVHSALASKATGGAVAVATSTVSPYAFSRSPSVSAAEADGDDVVRVYGSDRCPVAWRVHVSLLYKAANLRDATGNEHLGSEALSNCKYMHHGVNGTR
ncbi:hypothetical protein E2562_039511 [Oryza meyeriana var. granulata]|uniref:Uncharacterized protein n=1 Tax=Oryza meyeriana var. granulata TaxID=110450 RepID=A0A6G1CC58_9ORYZ|nr:hypothetical protein E2562_039511 [Oryza meyeriana var. granulata]